MENNKSLEHKDLINKLKTIIQYNIIRQRLIRGLRKAYCFQLTHNGPCKVAFTARFVTNTFTLPLLMPKQMINAYTGTINY